MAKLIKPYGVTVTVWASAERAEQYAGGFEELSTLLLRAPIDSPLRRAAVEADHTRTFPRFRVQCELRRNDRDTEWVRRFTLSFYVEEHENTDELVAGIRAGFLENGWES